MGWGRYLLFRVLRTTAAFVGGILLVWSVRALMSGQASASGFMVYGTAFIRTYGWFLVAIWLVLIVAGVVRDQLGRKRGKSRRSSPGTTE